MILALTRAMRCPSEDAHIQASFRHSARMYGNWTIQAIPNLCLTCFQYGEKDCPLEQLSRVRSETESGLRSSFPESRCQHSSFFQQPDFSLFLPFLNYVSRQLPVSHEENHCYCPHCHCSRNKPGSCFLRGHRNLPEYWQHYQQGRPA